MTKTLYLLRHAKSGWDDPVARDFDRPLNKRGEKAARTIGQWMASNGVTFEHVIASPAVLDVLREVDDAHETVMVVGHCPAVEDLVFDLVPDDGSSPLRDEVEIKYPTAALAQLEIPIDHWADIGKPVAHLKRFVRPRDLDVSLGPDEE